MIRFLYPQLLWLLALLPLLALLRGRRGTVAAVKYSSADIARQVARETRSRAGRWISTLSLLALGFIIVGLARPQFGRSTSTRRSQRGGHDPRPGLLGLDGGARLQT